MPLERLLAQKSVQSHIDPLNGHVAVLFSVRFVVLAIEGNQVIQREAIVAGDEIDALLRLAFFVLVYVRAPRQPESHCTGRPVVAFEKAANIVPKPPVPFLPAIADEAA